MEATGLPGQIPYNNPRQPCHVGLQPSLAEEASNYDIQAAGA
ncbi:MAG: hypothetical protein ACRDP7_43960 [Trebonia sp.]